MPGSPISSQPRLSELAVSQASLVIIRHAPRIVQVASQARMTQLA
jgi:hypothetical protein